MSDDIGPRLVGEGAIVCCEFRYEVRADGTYFEANESSWERGSESDPYWESYWSPVEDTATGSLQGTFDMSGCHTKGLLMPGEELLSITVHDWAASEWVDAPFAVARGRLWVAHLPRWPIAARVTTTLGTAERTWIHRRMGSFNSDMPEGINQIPRPELDGPPSDGFGWVVP